jgi:hypothetical protein
MGDCQFPPFARSADQRVQRGLAGSGGISDDLDIVRPFSDLVSDELRLMAAERINKRRRPCPHVQGGGDAEIAKLFQGLRTVNMNVRVDESGCAM